MDALDAKYPFFATAREAVADAAVSLPELVVATGAAAVAPANAWNAL